MELAQKKHQCLCPFDFDCFKNAVKNSSTSVPTCLDGLASSLLTQSTRCQLIHQTVRKLTSQLLKYLNSMNIKICLAFLIFEIFFTF